MTHITMLKVQSNRETEPVSAYPLELPAELLEEAQELASKDQIPLKQWLISAINAKIAVEKTRQLLQSHAQNADYAKFDTLLEKVPDVPPIEGDDI